MLKPRLKLITFIVCLSISSCMPALKLITGFKSPKVFTMQEAESFRVDHNLFDGVSLYPIVDTARAINDSDLAAMCTERFYEAFTLSHAFFDSRGQELKYFGNTECGGTLTSQFYDSSSYYFKIPEGNSIHTISLQRVLDSLITPEGKHLLVSDLPRADYYVIHKWNGFLQKPERTQQDLAVYSGRSDSTEIRICPIYVNTDLMAHWGLKQGAKIPVNSLGKINSPDRVANAMYRIIDK